MKNNKSRKSGKYSEYDEEDIPVSKKKESPRRRPVRNWTKAWESHQVDFDDHDDFYGK